MVHWNWKDRLSEKITVYKTAEVDKNQILNDLLAHVSNMDLIMKKQKIIEAFKVEWT